MADTAADVLIDTIHDWGVDVVFGLPGDGINGIMEALRTRQDRIRFVQVRHEESAAFMACGYAKFTGRLGVCLATSGPGGIHLLNGLYDAKLDGQPVLAITGLAYSRPDRHAHAAGRRRSIGCSWTWHVQRARHGPGPRRERRRSRVPHRAGLSRRRARHVPGRRPGDAGRNALEAQRPPPHVGRLGAQRSAAAETKLRKRPPRC